MAQSYGEQINDEYRLYCLDSSRGLERLSSLLLVYLEPIARMNLSIVNSRVSQLDVEDVIQNAIADILESGLNNFKDNKGQFATYCGRITTNKALDYRKKIVSRLLKETNDEEVMLAETWSDTDDNIVYFGSNPENIVLREEYYKQCRNWAEKFLKTYVNLDVKPYKLVGSGYSIILSKKYPTNNNKNDLTSAKWAYDQIENLPVKNGAESFINEVNEWIKYTHLSWNADFEKALEDTEYGQPMGQLVFGQHFDRKSIENWDNSIRKKIKREMASLEWIF